MWQGRFRDRAEAGRLLAAALARYAGRRDTIILALPRGGVPVAAEVADALDLPLDVLVVRKLGVPSQPELAMGAIASGGGRYINQNVVRRAAITQRTIDAVTARETTELRRREAVFRGDRPPLDVRDKTVIVIDDGIATGSTMIAGARALKHAGAMSIVIAVPVAPPGTEADMRNEADDFVCIETPASFLAVGEFYEEFPQLTDAAVAALLAGRHQAGTPSR